MGITGRSLAGAGLQGLGEGLQQWSAQTIKRKQIEDEWAFELKKQRLQQEAARATAEQGRQDKLIEGLMTRPGDTAALLDLAPLLLPNMKPEDLARLREAGLQHGTQQFTQRMNTLAKPEDAPADLRLAMSAATGHNYGTDASVPPTVDAAQWGGEGAESGVPEVLQAINAQKARLAQLDAAKQAAIVEAGQKSEAEAGGKKRGEMDVEHSNAPRTVQDAIDAINQKAGPEAAATRLKKHEELMAGVTPDVVAGEANKATTLKLAGLTPEIIGAEGREAGTKKGAEDRAAAAVKYDPANMANEINLAVDKATALAKAKGDTARQKYITDAKVGVMRLAPQLAIAKDLYDRAIKGDYAAAKLYQDKVASLAAPIAMATGYTGRMTVQEMHNVSGLLPSLVADTVLGAADEKWNNLAATMRYGPLVAAQLPTDATVADALAAAQALVDQEKQARTGRGTLPAAVAPSTPPPTPSSAAPPGKHLVFNPTTGKTEWQ